VQRPGLDRDLDEIFQRLDDLERAPGGDGDWVFVAEIVLGPGSGSFTFSSIPQDARHLVVVVEAEGSNCKLRFNADSTGGHYHTITSRLLDNAGTLTNTDAISGVTDGIDLACLNTDIAFGSRAVLQIPYYKANPADEFARFVEIEAWSITGNDAPHQWAHWKVAGWWYVNLSPRPAITSLSISALSGIGGLASLYKIM
jgi:hypothetical protein